MNGARGVVVKILRDIKGTPEVLRIRLDGSSKVHDIKRQRAVFRITENSPMAIAREQFPVILAYGKLSML